MNKRQRKKIQKRDNEFICSFVSSYKELKKFDRDYHNYVVDYERRKRCGHIKESLDDVFCN